MATAYPPGHFERSVDKLVTLFKDLRLQPATWVSDMGFQERTSDLCGVAVVLFEEMQLEGMGLRESLALMRPVVDEAREAARAHNVKLTGTFLAIAIPPPVSGLG